MKKALFILTFLSASIIYSDDRDIENIINRSTVEMNQNMAKLVIEGDISFLQSKYSIDSISLGLLNKEELRTLRNSIFAMRGYRFKTTSISEYFNRFDWYKPLLENVDILLSETDKKNIEMIKSFENSTNSIVTMTDLVGLWHDSLIMPSGYSRRIEFKKDGTFKFSYSQMREVPLIMSFSGTYELNTNSLKLIATKRIIIEHNGETDLNMMSGNQWTSSSQVEEEFNKEFLFPISEVKMVSDIYKNPPPGMETRKLIIMGNEVYFFLH